MPTRRRDGSGRTTPKGTKAPRKKKISSRSPGAEPASAVKDSLPDKVDRTPKFVSRPDSHNRGNR